MCITRITRAQFLIRGVTEIREKWGKRKGKITIRGKNNFDTEEETLGEGNFFPSSTGENCFGLSRPWVNVS